LVSADRSQAARVAADGVVVTTAQRVAAVSAGLRANLGMTMVVTEGRQAGIEVTDDVDAAIDRVRAGADSLVDRATQLDSLGADGEHQRTARAAHDAIEEVLLLIAEDPSDEAVATAVAMAAETLPLLDDVDRAAFSESQAAEARIAAEQARAGDAARASSMVVALLVPALAVLALWRSSRRRVERLALQAELDKNLALVRTRDELIAGIGHQLRTPLTGIIGYADTLQAAPDDPELRTEGLTIIQAQAGNLARMIDDMLVMARLEDGAVAVRTAPFDPTGEVEFVARMHADANVQTSVVPALVLGDRLRFRHILTNLVSNAIAHGGPSVVVKGAPSDDAYRVVVADDGQGIPAARLDEVFRPYAHSARDSLVTGSLGLGLAVAKQLAGQMDCRLSHQRVNGYTLFVLDLPLAESATPRITASAG
jgi:signal transduction histidine kinase